MTTFDRLNEIFREVFDDPDVRVEPDTTADDVEGWDSLSHVNLIVAIETRFGIRFSQKEVLVFRNVGDMAQAIERRLASP